MPPRPARWRTCRLGTASSLPSPPAACHQWAAVMSPLPATDGWSDRCCHHLSAVVHHAKVSPWRRDCSQTGLLHSGTTVGGDRFGRHAAHLYLGSAAAAWSGGFSWRILVEVPVPSLPMPFVTLLQPPARLPPLQKQGSRRHSGTGPKVPTPPHHQTYQQRAGTQ
jgi:hypothetical protein